MSMKVAGCCNGGCCAAANELLFPGAASSAARPTPFSLSLSLSRPLTAVSLLLPRRQYGRIKEARREAVARLRCRRPRWCASSISTSGESSALTPPLLSGGRLLVPVVRPCVLILLCGGRRQWWVAAAGGSGGWRRQNVETSRAGEAPNAPLGAAHLLRQI
jgi:hypothetical protein